MYWAESRGFRPNTRLNGDSASAVLEGVILQANDISYFGEQVRSLWS